MSSRFETDVTSIIDNIREAQNSIQVTTGRKPNSIVFSAPKNCSMPCIDVFLIKGNYTKQITRDELLKKDEHFHPSYTTPTIDVHMRSVVYLAQLHIIENII